VTVVASGPLTSDALAEALRERVGEAFLGFYDAAAPVIDGESIDMDVAYRKGRYGQAADYLNLPFTRERYERFIALLAEARSHTCRTSGRSSSSSRAACRSRSSRGAASTRRASVR
jgi:methylenetetrahydrofolate--tRNA-(uracil-5-)-methyltransferase